MNAPCLTRLPLLLWRTCPIHVHVNFPRVNTFGAKMWAGLGLLDSSFSQRVVRLSEAPHLCGRARLIDSPSCPVLVKFQNNRSRGSSLVSTAALEDSLDRRSRQIAALASTDQQELPIWDVVGLGQAMVDISAAVDDEFVARTGIAKGERK